MKLEISKTFNSFSWRLPRISVMDWYLTKELIGPFLFGVGLFSSVGVTVGAVFELVRRVTESGLPFSTAIQIFLLKMPYFIVLAFPMSMLLASLMAYSRMSSDSEIVALRSCGINVYRLVVPAVILSLAVTGMTFAMNELIVPAANYQATVTLDRALKREKPLFQEKNIFYPEFRNVDKGNGEESVLTRLFYAEQFDGKQMKGLTILDRSQPELNQIISSESAIWNPAQNSWDFFNGTVYIVAPDGSYRNIVRFEHQQLQLPRTPLDLAAKARDYGEMNIAQAIDYLNLIRSSGDEQKIRKLKVRIQEKYALPFVCIVFGLVGAALGTKPQRTGRATSFGISVIVIFTYYVFSFITSSMGLKAVLTPVMAAWLPMICGLGVGGLLLVRASR
ncbi:LptF/LptG family permease [Kamptonema animale CS-326]|jgi:lipopolysaccharide export system permease protein|uniref:LptF/LptG family permease n=1 Tax=Kamptonema animale TaxID=92934 RepID=UPI00232AA889|nr:LptF/LptG family permease [Kamptonema animale]MDB9509852.1 LptF/LptG family permease [Kamptonema animale CS-326]